MKICILGASRGTGAEAVRTALDRGHEVTAFARNPGTLVLDDPRLARWQGDFHSRDSVEGAVRGHDAVIITSSSTTLRGFKENPSYFSVGTGYAIDAMKAHGVRRLVVLSALGAGESLRLMNFFVRKLVVSMLLKAPFEDHEQQEKLVMESGLDWVIARP